MRLQHVLEVALAALLSARFGLAQVGRLSSETGTRSAQPALHLNVVVSGGSAEGLQQNEVTLLDNGAPAIVQSLQPLGGKGNAPAHVIVVIDDINARLTTVAYERDQLRKFFLKNDGQLRVPFTLAVMTDTRLDIQPAFSQDGHAEDQALQQYKVGLHEITRSSQYGGFDRSSIGVRSLEQLARYAAGIPGHKLILFMSPGWPLLSGPRIQLSAKQEESLYDTTAELQNAMLRANITLDMINPFGPGESLVRSDDYQGYLKGVKKPDKSNLADLSLQVLAVHSGGTVQQGSSNLEGMVEHSLADLDHSFTLTFVPGPSDTASEYHSLKVQVNRPGLTVRTPDEYYTGAPANK